MKLMNIVFGIVAMSSLLLCTGCTKTEKGLSGAVIGAGSGAIIGGAAGGGTGALIGAGVGAIGGGVIGHSMGDD